MFVYCISYCFRSPMIISIVFITFFHNVLSRHVSIDLHLLREWFGKILQKWKVLNSAMCLVLGLYALLSTVTVLWFFLNNRSDEFPQNRQNLFRKGILVWIKSLSHQLLFFQNFYLASPVPVSIWLNWNFGHIRSQYTLINI